MGLRDRVRKAVQQTWYRGVDYGWAMREIGRGIARPSLPHRFTEGDLAPVLLLPGVLENWTMMRRIAELLSLAGHPVHALPELRRNTVSVVEASALGSAYLAANELRGVVLVAHSKGGLIGKRMLLGDVDGRIERLVTVSTPFGGSSLAVLIPHRTIRSLRPDDATIVELAGHTEVNERIVSIFPTFDPHIPGGSSLDGAKNVPLETSGHFRVLGEPAVVDAVVNAVGDAGGDGAGGGSA